MLTLFLAIFQRSVKISKQSTDIFGILLSVGIGIKIITYAFINSAVVAGIVPTTGLPMPFVSFGGTNLLMTLFTIGILLNISMAKRIHCTTRGNPVLHRSKNDTLSWSALHCTVILQNSIVHHDLA